MLPAANPGATASERGSVLLASLVAVVAMAVLCAALMQFSGRVSREHATDIDDLRALYLAEAGLSESFAGLFAGKNGVVGSPEIPAKYGHGVFWVEVEELAPGRVVLRSTGAAGMGRKTLELVVELNELNLASLGVFADEELVLEPGALADSFDSDLGTYDEQDTWPDPPADGGDAILGSNGPILLQEGATVFGNLTPGTGSSVSLEPDAQVTGTTAPADETVDLPGIDPPTPDSLGNYRVPEYSQLSIPSGAVRYEELVVQAGGQLTLTGPLELVVGSLSTLSGSTLVFDTSSGPIDLYIEGNLNLSSGSTLSSSGTDVADSVIYLLGNSADPAGTEGGGGPGGSGAGLLAWSPAALLQEPVQEQPAEEQAWSERWTDMGWVPEEERVGAPANTHVIECSGTFYGFVYGPDADLRIPGGLHVLGGVAARRLTLGTGSRVSFDEQLATGVVNDQMRLVVRSWSIQELPDVPLVKTRLDPFYLLNRDGVVPVRSADAHQQKAFRIVYTDGDGITRTYLGIEELFDWSVVDTVVDLEREGDPNNDPWPKVTSTAATDEGRTSASDGQHFYYDTTGTRDVVAPR